MPRKIMNDCVKACADFYCVTGIGKPNLCGLHEIYKINARNIQAMGLFQSNFPFTKVTPVHFKPVPDL